MKISLPWLVNFFIHFTSWSFYTSPFKSLVAVKEESQDVEPFRAWRMISMSFHHTQPTWNIHLNGLCFKCSALRSHKCCFSGRFCWELGDRLWVWQPHKMKDVFACVIHNTGLRKETVTPDTTTASPSQNSGGCNTTKETKESYLMSKSSKSTDFFFITVFIYSDFTCFCSSKIVAHRAK